MANLGPHPGLITLIQCYGHVKTEDELSLGEETIVPNSETGSEVDPWPYITANKPLT